MQRQIRHVLLDLGNVLVRFRGISSLAERLDVGNELMATHWLESPAVRAYERGHSTTDQFVTAAISDLNLAFGRTLSESEFRDEMRTWLPGVWPGALELLSELDASSVPHSCLSNTNPLHWDVMRGWGIHHTFAHCFLSHELGTVKPDRQFFQAALQRLALAPAEVCFLDDHPANVDAARSFGLLAARVEGPHQARDQLARWNVLEED